MQTHSKKQVLVLTIIAAPRDNMQVGDNMEIYKLVSQQMSNSWSWSWFDQAT